LPLAKQLSSGNERERYFATSTKCAVSSHPERSDRRLANIHVVQPYWVLQVQNPPVFVHVLCTAICNWTTGGNRHLNNHKKLLFLAFIIILSL